MKGIDEMEIFNKLRNIVKKENKNLQFNILVEEWLENKKLSIKESTYCNYVYAINKFATSAISGFSVFTFTE